MFERGGAKPQPVEVEPVLEPQGRFRLDGGGLDRLALDGDTGEQGSGKAAFLSLQPAMSDVFDQVIDRERTLVDDREPSGAIDEEAAG